LNIESGVIQFTVNPPEARPIVPLNQRVVDMKPMKKVPEYECLFLSGPVQAEYDMGEIGHIG
jgi:hypothetical protein